jgi:two-component system nitrate/nitrite response regulator NarL
MYLREKSVPEQTARPMVLLVDDHALFRESIRRFLEAEANVTVVGSVGSIEEARLEIERTLIDLILLDYDLGEQDGIDFMRQARALGFQGKVLLVTAGIEPGKIAALLNLGVAGVFLKHSPPELLKRAISEVLAGNAWIDRNTLQKAMQVKESASRWSETRLTDRESQVLSFVFDGLSNKEIADRISVSESAVKATIQQLFQKTGVRTRSQLVRVALERFERHP